MRNTVNGYAGKGNPMSEVMPFLLAGFLLWVCLWIVLDLSLDALNWWLDRRDSRRLVEEIERRNANG